jgi:hypothetical protein
MGGSWWRRSRPPSSNAGRHCAREQEEEETEISPADDVEMQITDFLLRYYRRCIGLVSFRFEFQGGKYLNERRSSLCIS